MENNTSKQSLTFQEEVEKILKEENDPRAGMDRLKMLFLSSQNPLVLRVLRGDVSFVKPFLPLIQEYDKLRLTSLLSDTCMNEKFIQEGNKLRNEMSEVISLSKCMTYIQSGKVVYCDITQPFSRQKLVTKTFGEIVNSFKMTLFLFLINIFFAMIALDDLAQSLFIFNSVIVGFLSVSFFVLLYKNYLYEFSLRKETCKVICMQVLILDDIVEKIFFNKK